jgi:hypothetical protein
VRGDADVRTAIQFGGPIVGVEKGDTEAGNRKDG